jgi:hypothetical protein
MGTNYNWNSGVLRQIIFFDPRTGLLPAYLFNLNNLLCSSHGPARESIGAKMVHIENEARRARQN